MKTFMKITRKPLLVFAIIGAGMAGAANESFAGLQTYGIIGDAGVPNENTRAVRRSLHDSRIRELVLPGDNVYDVRLSYGDIWDAWKDEGFLFPVVALGNHTRGYDEELRYFGHSREHYSTTNGIVRFLVLNSDNPRTVREQAKWLEDRLRNAREPFVFVVYHHPPFTVSTRHGWREKENFHLQTFPILLAHEKKVTGLIVGHDHIASLVEVGPIPMIVSGATFESIPTKGVAYSDRGIDVKTRWLFKNGTYWARLDANPETDEVWVNYVRAYDGSVDCSARIHPRPLLLRSNCGRTGEKRRMKSIPKVKSRAIL